MVLIYTQAVDKLWKRPG